MKLSSRQTEWLMIAALFAGALIILLIFRKVRKHENAQHALHPNVRAFLNTITRAEGMTPGPQAYRTLFGYGTFTDMSKHPRKCVPFTNPATGKRDCSTAAGAYQFNWPTWREISMKLGLTDFSEESQDIGGVELLRMHDALDDIIAGRFENAARKVGGRWASFPHNNYKQPQRSMATLKSYFTQYGGKIA